MKRQSRIRGTSPEIIQAARQLRTNLTPTEAKLWEALRNRQVLGLKFRCQHAVGNFILDFYCPAVKLAIEVDGKIHQHQQEYDRDRTEKLAEYGYSVLRFSNQEVLNELPQVLKKIEAEASKKLNSSFAP